MQGQKIFNSKHQKIQISVSAPLIDTAKGHFTYLVSGSDNKGEIDIRRRFNDFYYLRESLCKRWPGIYIPPVPQKIITGNKDQGNIEMRRRYFQLFLSTLSQSNHLFYCSITQEFLRNKSLDMQKFFTTFSYPKPQQTLAEYGELFPEIPSIGLGDKSPTIQQKKVISDFNIYLKKADTQLKGIKGTIQNIVQARNNFVQSLNIVNSTTLPEYQKNVYSEYLPVNSQQDSLFFASNTKIQQNVQKLKVVSQQNSFQVCLDLISYELRQVEAMQYLLESREGFQAHYHKCKEKLLSAESEMAKLMGGKTTFKSLFSKGNKDDQIKTLQSSIPQMRAQLQSWRKFVNSTTILISEKEIVNFKRSKMLKYYSVMNKTSQRELNYLAVYGDLMKSIMQGIIKVK